MRRETLCGVCAEASAETFEASYRVKAFQGLRMYERSQIIRLEGKRSWIGIVVERVNVNNSRGYVGCGDTNAGTITRIASAEVGGAFDMLLLTCTEGGVRIGEGAGAGAAERKKERKLMSQTGLLLADRKPI